MSLVWTAICMASLYLLKVYVRKTAVREHQSSDSSEGAAYGDEYKTSYTNSYIAIIY